MHDLFMAVVMSEVLLKNQRESEIERHTRAARALRREERAARRTQPREPYFSFLPRLTGYPTGR